MSTPSPASPRAATRFPELPKGEVVTSHETYQQAQHDVDRLARADFAVSHVSIVGSDIKSVERVTGRLSYGKVALMGALSGAYMGLFFGLILFLFQPENSSIWSVFLAAIIIGAGFGMLFGVLSYSMNRNRRDFSSVMQMVASRYDVVVDPDLAHKARNILQSPEQQ
ncbi:general stress protein [Lysinibacter cavernae]|uniref:General stress protein 17M-like domain-containing protein n=1 Tax=Lysinibacter cavernae TaxID=1640652 RepID=A0A7X5QYR7_9MICO|nr:general stress protein [Lysinibacter cavernae]NIH52347.1 hypothetical protein [Lysinibacter cavernae]